MTGRRRLSPRGFDYALTGAVLVAVVGEILFSSSITGPRWATALLGAAMSLLLLWRRSHPVATVAALFAIIVPQAGLITDPSELVATFFPLLVLAYGAGAYAEPRGGRIALAMLAAGIVAVGLVGEGSSTADVLFPIAVTALCWLAGRTVRTRARLAAELHEVAARAEEQREQEAQQAVADERRRIAREVHDVVAHNISLMVVQAGGARRILGLDPERAEQAARRIRRAGEAALAEMDTLLGVLEAAPGDGRRPSLDLLGELVEQAEHAGLPVTLDVRGARRPLPAGAELAAYRVVQEALTNAIKHAGGATTRVELSWGDEALELRVADRGDGGPAPRLAGAGHGLMGMRERVRQYGGDVETGPRAGGGFEVVARLPFERVEAGVR